MLSLVWKIQIKFEPVQTGAIWTKPARPPNLPWVKPRATPTYLPNWSDLDQTGASWTKLKRAGPNWSDPIHMQNGCYASTSAIVAKKDRSNLLLMAPVETGPNRMQLDRT